MQLKNSIQVIYTLAQWYLINKCHVFINNLQVMKQIQKKVYPTNSRHEKKPFFFWLCVRREKSEHWYVWRLMYVGYERSSMIIRSKEHVGVHITQSNNCTQGCRGFGLYDLWLTLYRYRPFGPWHTLYPPKPWSPYLPYYRNATIINLANVKNSLNYKNHRKMLSFIQLITYKWRTNGTAHYSYSRQLDSPILIGCRLHFLTFMCVQSHFIPAFDLNYFNATYINVQRHILKYNIQYFSFSNSEFDLRGICR